MFPDAHQSIPLQAIDDPLLLEKEISLSVLRMDQTDPIISGNKWFKLKHNFIAAKKQGFQTLLSFGGRYSNHIHALATAGKACGFNTIGIIRGEECLPLNPTLSDAVAQGMRLYYVNRQIYRDKHSHAVVKQLQSMVTQDAPFMSKQKHENSDPDKKPPDQFYLLPEGGTNDLAVKGAAEIAAFIPKQTDFVCLPLGTGGTAAGIITGLAQAGQQQTRVLGFAAMKGGEFLEQAVRNLLVRQKKLATLPRWQLVYDYHFGGFGKVSRPLAFFIQDFEQKHALELEPIYTAKMMYAIVKLINDNYFPKGSKIIAIHTGGLQGKRGMQEKLQTLLSD